MTPMTLDRDTVLRYCRAYDDHHRGTRDEKVEVQLRQWFEANRYLDLEHLCLLAGWLTSRLIPMCRKNQDSAVREVTRRALAATDEAQMVEMLCRLRGVQIRVASVILHFAFPDQYMIMTTPDLLALDWQPPAMLTVAFWHRYTRYARETAQRLGVSLRDLDKALNEYTTQHG